METEKKKASIAAGVDNSGCINIQVMGSEEDLLDIMAFIVQSIARSSAESKEDITDIIFAESAWIMERALNMDMDGTVVDLSKVAENMQGGETL